MKYAGYGNPVYKCKYIVIATNSFIKFVLPKRYNYLRTVLFYIFI